MSPDKLLLGYVTVLLAGIGLVAILGELRTRRFRPERTEDRIFKCDKCSSVYTDDPDVERSRCPHCGQLNHAIEF